MTTQSGQLAPPIVIGQRSERPPGGTFLISDFADIAVAPYRNALRDSKYTTLKFHTASLARILAARIRRWLGKNASFIHRHSSVTSFRQSFQMNTLLVFKTFSEVVFSLLIYTCSYTSMIFFLCHRVHTCKYNSDDQ